MLFVVSCLGRYKFNPSLAAAHAVSSAKSRPPRVALTRVLAVVSWPKRHYSCSTRGPLAGGSGNGGRFRSTRRIRFAFSDSSRVAHKSSLPLDPYAVRERTAFLSASLASNRVNFINPTPALLKHDQETRMYNLYDIHFTVAGNKVVADETLPVIQSIIQRNGPAWR